MLSNNLMNSMRVSWKSLAPIFADVVISPWNLLVGGLLIGHLSTLNMVISLAAGYAILAVIFVLYGGLGFKTKKLSLQIIGDVFASKHWRHLATIILAGGQIGWAAINFDLGGRSLATLFSVPSMVGIGIYAIFLTFLTTWNLSKMGLFKTVVVISSLGLMAYSFFGKLYLTSFSHFLTYQPTYENSLFWGISIVVASLISFSTVTPDFFRSVKHKRDIVISSVLGLIPGMFTALLGGFLFFDQGSINLVALLSVMAMPVFPHIFNVITNTDGTTAIYTPGLKFKELFDIGLKPAIFLAGSISLILALLGIASHLEIWLKFLSLFFPACIGVCFSVFLFKGIFKAPSLRTITYLSFMTALVPGLILSSYLPAAIFSLVIPLLFFTLAGGYRRIPSN